MLIYFLIIVFFLIIIKFTTNHNYELFDYELMDDHTTHDKSVWQGGCVGSIFYPGNGPCPEETPYYWNPSNNKIGICCNIYKKKNSKKTKNNNCRNNIKTNNKS